MGVFSLSYPGRLRNTVEVIVRAVIKTRVGTILFLGSSGHVERLVGVGRQMVR